jgi:hypothetical protein
MKIYVVAVFVCAVIGFSYLQELKIERLKLASVISEQKYTIQENQLRDYENQFRKYQEQNTELTFKVNSSKTYEQGYQDALLKLDTRNYVGTYSEGFEDAKKALGGNYVDGYHKAMSQQADAEFYRSNKKDDIDFLNFDKIAKSKD